MRLDQFIQLSCFVSRREAKQLLRSKRITVNGEIIRQAGQIISLEKDIICCDGKSLLLDITPRYLVLYKPLNYVCSHRDDGYPSIFRLLKEERMANLHIAGRLDADTTGLVLLTDDGEWSHKVTHPNNHCPKIYRVGLADPITSLAVSSLEEGVFLRGDAEKTLPATVNVLDEFTLELEIREGRYHQVKRMLAAVGNKVISLHRYKIGDVSLEGLNEGEYRHLTDKEIEGF